MKFSINDLNTILDSLMDEMIICRAATMTHTGYEGVKAKRTLDNVTKVYGKIALIVADIET